MASAVRIIRHYLPLCVLNTDACMGCIIKDKCTITLPSLPGASCIRYVVESLITSSHVTTLFTIVLFFGRITLQDIRKYRNKTAVQACLHVPKAYRKANEIPVPRIQT